MTCTEYEQYANLIDVLTSYVMLPTSLPKVLHNSCGQLDFNYTIS